MESEMKTLIESTLGIPCYLDADTMTFPSATVEGYLDSPGLIGDGEESSVEQYLQVDLWYTGRTERDEAVKLLKTAIRNTNQYTAPDVERFFDTEAKKYRATLKLSTIEEG